MKQDWYLTKVELFWTNILANILFIDDSNFRYQKMLIMWIYIFLKKTHIKSTHLLRKASWKFRIFKSRILQREDSHEYLYPQAFFGYFFLHNLKKRKFLSFYCWTSLCVLIDLVQQGVLLSYNLTRLILAHAGNIRL